MDVASAFPQASGNKSGGICFRVDDDQPIQAWKDFAAVFRRHSLNFSFALNLSPVAANPAYIQLVRDLQQAGNELMDHTPDHAVHYFTIANPSAYAGLPGVDHVAGDRVCLAYDRVDTTRPLIQRGRCSINGNHAVSLTKGAFSSFLTANVLYIGLYFPRMEVLCGVADIQAANSSDVDSLTLTTFWGEGVNFKPRPDEPYFIVSQSDVKMPKAARRLLAQRTLSLCAALGIQRPYTWISPGGRWPDFTKAEQLEVLPSLGYLSATATDHALKCYGEYDPAVDARYGMQWGDFLDDACSLQWNETIITDAVARHYVLIGHSHFTNLLGGWTGYLGRVDSLLAWCESTNIAVKTQLQWANLLYGSDQNPYINIMPSLNIDRDRNGVPDGYTMKSGVDEAVYDTANGVAAGGNCSIRISKVGTLCSVNDLGGLEHGANDFTIWIKGSGTVDVAFGYPGKNYPVVHVKFVAEKAAWRAFSLSQSANGVRQLVIPSDVSLCNVTISCTQIDPGSTIAVSGMTLRKHLDAPLKIVSSPVLQTEMGTRYAYSLQVACRYPEDPISYQLQNSPSWLSVSSAGLISGVPAATGRFSVTLIARDAHADADTQRYTLSVSNPSPPRILPSLIFLGKVRQGTVVDTSLSFANSDADTMDVTALAQLPYFTAQPRILSVPPGASRDMFVHLIADSAGKLLGRILVYRLAGSTRDTVTIEMSVVGSASSGTGNGSPYSFALLANYPNPFNPSTTIPFELDRTMSVRLEVYNDLGERMRTIADGEVFAAGRHQLMWDGRNDRGTSLPSGIYICRIRVEGLDGSMVREASRKMLLLK